MSKIRPISPKTCNTRLHRPGNKPHVMDWDNTPTGHNELHVIRLDWPKTCNTRLHKRTTLQGLDMNQMDKI